MDEARVRVEGTGPIPSRIAYIGEAPAEDEIRSGMPFTGPSGQVLWQFSARYAGLAREDVYVDNLSQEPWPTDEDGEWIKPAPHQLAALTDDLMRRLEVVHPSYVVTFGQYSTVAALGRWTAMEAMHGRAIKAPGYTSLDYTVIPVFHPAAGMYEPARLAYTADGLAAVRAIIHGEPTPPLPNPRTRPYKVGAPKWDIRAAAVAIDTESLPQPDGSWKPWGLSWSVRPGTGWVIKADDHARLARFRSWLAWLRPVVYLHNALADLEPLRAMGIDVLGMGLEVRDTMVLAYHQGTEPQGLKRLGRRYVGLEMRDYDDVVKPHWTAELKRYLATAYHRLHPPLVERIGKRGQPLKPKLAPASREFKRIKRLFSDLRKEPGLDPEKRWTAWREDGVVTAIEGAMGRPAPMKSLTWVPEREAVVYSAEDANATISVAPFLENLVFDHQLVAHDFAVLPMVDRMQQAGLLLNRQKHAEFQAELESKKAALTEVIGALVGDPEFLPSSGDDIGDWLLRERMDPGERTKTGKVKTGKRQLSRVAQDHPAVPLIIEFKEIDKLLGTYLKPLIGFVRADGRVHPNYRVTRVPSGRLAASEPNLMAFPARTTLGKRVRGLFEAPPGRLLGSWDFSQLEIVVVADESGDPVLCSALIAGRDVHTTTASGIFGVPYDLVDKDRHRKPAKILNYLILYGGGPAKLHEELLAAGVYSFDVEDSERLIREWFTLYSGVRDYRMHTIREARRAGYAEDRWGRRRKLPALGLLGDRWPFSKLREEAERQAFSQRIQGGADGFIKRAEVRIERELLPAVPSALPLLQIHDEMLMEFDEADTENVNRLMLAAMLGDAQQLIVPLGSSGSYGRTWEELK